MRRKLLCLTVATGLLLSACAGPTSASNPSATAEDATAAGTSATPAPTVTPEPGLPYEEIAARCGIRAGSARVIEYRTRQRLKEILRKEGYL